MTSITTWTRIEPRARGDDLRPSLEARVHDPAWLLGRQWQLGEFAGEDVGSLADVRLVAQAAPLTACAIGPGVAALDPARPLDAQVGAESRSPMTGADRAEAGAEWLALAAEAGCSDAGVRWFVGSAWLPTLPVAGDGGSWLALAAQRLPDGAALEPLLRQVADTGAPPAGPGQPWSAADAAALVRAARAWVDWLGSVTGAAQAAGSAWVDANLEYQFKLAMRPAGGPDVALAAPSWTGDRLDWHDFDVDRRMAAPQRPATAAPLPDLPGVDPATGRLESQGVPVPLAYPGMPASRWWQFEDGRVNFAQLEAAPEDLARLLLTEFACVYSNDWYLWPLELPFGAMHQVQSLEAVSTFGDRFPIRAVPASAGGSTSVDWQLFRPTEQTSDGPKPFDGLLLLPTLAAPLDGAVLEDVRFARDEMANMAWAIERTVEGADGLPLDRHGDTAASGGLPVVPPARAGSDGEPPRYRLQTDVPAYWYPLVPAADGSGKLSLLTLRRVAADGSVDDAAPLGRLLAPEGLWLWQEEVPREGARALRRSRMARAADGTLCIWRARLAQTGRGEASSGLRYDDLLPVPRP